VTQIVGAGTAPAACSPRALHLLHSGERTWRESNCYVDLWIGLLHHLRLDPVAMLACGIAPQFELDQWTFCKPTASEIARLYGLRVEELTIWRDLGEQIRRQLAHGRVVMVEVDAFHLPDTRGVSYRTAHQKTTIGVREWSADGITYFHNAGQFTLGGEDLAAVMATSVIGAGLPPFAEFVDPARMTVLDPPTLRARSREIARARLAIAAQENPYAVWSRCADEQLDELASRDLAHFHAWAFATVRQAGAMAELLGAWCDWVSEQGQLAAAGASLRELAQTLAAQQFRLARVATGSFRKTMQVELINDGPVTILLDSRKLF